MTIPDVRWAIVLGAGYVFLVLFWFAGYCVGRMEGNVTEARRIVSGYAPK